MEGLCSLLLVGGDLNYLLPWILAVHNESYNV